MRSKALIPSIVFLFLLSLVSPVSDLEASIVDEIEGRILTTASNQRLSVRLEIAGQVRATAYTDHMGRFSFPAMSPGTYWVVVDLGEFGEYEQQVEVFRGMPTITVHVPSGVARVVRKPVQPDSYTVDVGRVAEKPRKAVANYEQAIKAVRRDEAGRRDEAIRLLEEAVDIAPDYYEAHHTLGVLYHHARRVEDAERALLRASELDPRAIRPRINLGVLYGETKRYEQAHRFFEEATRLSPPAAEAFFGLGLTLFHQNRIQEAEGALNRARELDPDLAGTRLILADVYASTGRRGKAVEQLNAYLEEKPDSKLRPQVEERRAELMKNSLLNPR